MRKKSMPNFEYLVSAIIGTIVIFEAGIIFML